MYFFALLSFIFIDFLRNKKSNLRILNCVFPFEDFIKNENLYLHNFLVLFRVIKVQIHVERMSLSHSLNLDEKNYSWKIMAVGGKICSFFFSLRSLRKIFFVIV